MNEKKICFIMCVNNDEMEQECLKYLNRLQIPEGYEIDQISVREAGCMTEGYEAAMESSDAKYKVYMHQDVMLVNPHLIQDLLMVFQNSEIGMIGMIGAPELCNTGVMWEGERVGRIYTSNILNSGEAQVGVTQAPWQEVETVDGLFMATQYDLPWREDLFRGWDFYDAAQSLEFRKAEYKVVVPYMDQPWCIHDDGMIHLDDYFKWHKIFMDEYQDYLKCNQKN